MEVQHGNGNIATTVQVLAQYIQSGNVWVAPEKYYEWMKKNISVFISGLYN